MPTFTYVGPLDEVELVVRVKHGEHITVPDAVAGRPPHQEHDADGVLILNDLGEGLLAQPHAWEPLGVDELVVTGPVTALVMPVEDLTVTQLKNHAAEHGIDLGSASTKTEIIAALEALAVPETDLDETDTETDDMTPADDSAAAAPAGATPQED